MGIYSESINVYGVKYDLDAYNNKVKTESINELLKICEILDKPCDDVDDILDFLEDEVFTEIKEFGNGDDIDIVLYGNTVCDTRNDPFGVILHTKTQEAEQCLKQILTKIGSNKKFGQHSEIYTG